MYMCTQPSPHCIFEGKQKCFNSRKNISTTVHAMTKSFVPFCSAQDGESTDMNCSVF